jgi:hypothetical protein
LTIAVHFIDEPEISDELGAWLPPLSQALCDDRTSSIARLPIPGSASSSSSVIDDNLLTRLMPLERSALTIQAGILLRASMSLEAARGFDVRAGREAILIPQMIATARTGVRRCGSSRFTVDCKHFHPTGWTMQVHAER